MRNVPPAISPATGAAARLPLVIAVQQCAGGAFHTAMNSLSAGELEEAARMSKVTDVRSFLCAQIYPLPGGYDGPLNGTACGCADPGPGLIEANARLELARRGGCASAAPENQAT